MYEDLIAERLSALREQKNISAREMSLDLGQNESYINRIENKKTFPSMQVFFYICEYLDITPQDFFNVKSEQPQKLHLIINGLCELNEQQFNIVYELINEFRKSKK